MPSVLRFISGFALLFLLAGPFAKTQQEPAHKPTIVSTTHPKDSRGERVYDEQDEAQKDAPVVPGVLVPPELMHWSKPKIPMSSRMHHRKLDIIVEGVIAANGDMIDVTLVKEDADSALAKNVSDAFSRCKFKPGTLNGNPVAVLVQTHFHFNVF